MMTWAVVSRVPPIKLAPSFVGECGNFIGYEYDPPRRTRGRGAIDRVGGHVDLRGELLKRRAHVHLEGRGAGSLRYGIHVKRVGAAGEDVFHRFRRFDDALEHEIVHVETKIAKGCASEYQQQRLYV